MKKKTLFQLSFLVVAGLSLTACKKDLQEGIIHRDCSGTYIELDNKDYKICNPEMTQSFQDEAEVSVQFENSTNCPTDTVTFVCELYHHNYGTVNILEINEN